MFHRIILTSVTALVIPALNSYLTQLEQQFVEAVVSEQVALLKDEKETHQYLGVAA